MLMIVPLGLSLYRGGDLYDMILISRQISQYYRLWVLKQVLTFQMLGEIGDKEIRDCGIDSVTLEVKHNWWFTWDLGPDKSFEVNKHRDWSSEINKQVSLLLSCWREKKSVCPEPLGACEVLQWMIFCELITKWVQPWRWQTYREASTSCASAASSHSSSPAPSTA